MLHQGDKNSLLESLSIVERQTLKDIEVIIVNQSTEEIASISQQMNLSFNIKIIDENSCAELSDMITGDYITFLSSNDSLFDWTFEKMYHAIKLSDSDVVLGHFADLVDGVFYFYPWGGDNWLTENLTNVQVLQKMDDTDHRIRKQYRSLFGKLFNSKLLRKINQFDINNLIWRLYIHSKTATYINFPTYIYKPVIDAKPLKDSYKIILENYENRIKDCAVLENYDIERAKKQYIQELANFSAWLKND
ncbi:TPA: capsular biosynthesis protein, partial [Streptococcus pneumoniae]